KAAKAHVIAFRVATPKRIQDIAAKDGVEAKEYWIIYDATDFLQAELKRIATPVEVVKEIGRLKVLALFSKKGTQAIVGGEVLSGEIKKDLQLVINRSKEEVGKGKIIAVKVGKVEVDLAEKGTQCGLSVETDAEIVNGDILVANTVSYE
ncbi:MAG: hypothetical protein WD157_01330, partial [Patescibacteria group bacterium]